jgi:hypothetical protein
MKNMLTMAILIILALSSLSGATSASDLPAVLTEIEGAKPNKYFKKVKDIPIPVKQAFGQTMQSKEFDMADRGGAWNKTDVVTNPSLPFRRLIWAVEIKGYYVIHYEMGGIGYSTHYLIAALDRGKDKWSVLWSAAAFESSRDFPAFIADLKKGKLNSDPKISH